MSETLAPARPVGNDFHGALKRLKPAIEAEYRRLTPRSAALFEAATSVFPGGFTRDAYLRAPYAPFLESGRGALLRDADGRELVDMWFNATALPLGHCHPAVQAAAAEQLAKGTAFFGPGETDLALGRLVLDRLMPEGRIRFTNSGSEAVMLALRLARAFTGRPIVAKFEGSYHGSYDDVSWSVGAGAAAMGEAERPNAAPDTLGLPAALGRALVLPFDDLPAASRLIEEYATDIAALIIEPMASRMGHIVPERGFLEGLAALCRHHGILLVFDEVIAFRVGYRGAQGLLGITPDLTTLGKIIGGGFPVGAVVGRAEIMEASRPFVATRVTHAGTFNANPMTMAAGLATMRLLTEPVFAELAARGAALRARLAALCEGLPLQVTGAGSLFKITALDRPIRSYRDSVHADRAWEQVASLALLNRGWLLTPQLQGCVSVVTTDAQLDGFVAAVAEVIRLG
jgi:glutamate-1-semialdehyde 2,1-aminomutase